MSNTTIDLPEWFRRQEEFQYKVTEAEKQAVAARSRLYEASEDIKRIVLRELDQGQSTGDVVQDEAFRIFGLNKQVLDKLVAFSDRLIHSKGKEMLAIFPYQMQVRFSGPGDERKSDYQECRGYILGILSGERLELAESKDNIWDGLKVVLPFERHVTWGFNINHNAGALQPKIGKVTLCGFSIPNLGEPSADSFINSVIGEKDATVSIFVGDDTEDQSQRLHLPELIEIRKVLNSATAEEQTAGANI